MKFIFAFFMMAHAGWISDKCRGWLVEIDPHQFNESSQPWLEGELKRLNIKRAWNKATQDDLDYIRIIEKELQMRRNIKALTETPTE